MLKDSMSIVAILFYSPTVRQVYRSQLSELSNSVFEIDTFGKPLPKVDQV